MTLVKLPGLSTSSDSNLFSNLERLLISVLFYFPASILSFQQNERLRPNHLRGFSATNNEKTTG